MPNKRQVSGKHKIGHLFCFRTSLSMRIEGKFLLSLRSAKAQSKAKGKRSNPFFRDCFVAKLLAKTKGARLLRDFVPRNDGRGTALLAMTKTFRI